MQNENQEGQVAESGSKDAALQDFKNSPPDHRRMVFLAMLGGMIEESFHARGLRSPGEIMLENIQRQLQQENERQQRVTKDRIASLKRKCQISLMEAEKLEQKIKNGKLELERNPKNPNRDKSEANLAANEARLEKIRISAFMPATAESKDYPDFNIMVEAQDAHYQVWSIPYLQWKSLKEKFEQTK